MDIAHLVSDCLRKMLGGERRRSLVVMNWNKDDVSDTLLFVMIGKGRKTYPFVFSCTRFATTPDILELTSTRARPITPMSKSRVKMKILAVHPYTYNQVNEWEDYGYECQRRTEYTRQRRTASMLLIQSTIGRLRRQGVYRFGAMTQ